MSLILDSSTAAISQPVTEVTSSLRTVTTADSAPTGAAGVDTIHASHITLGIRNFVAVTNVTFQTWLLIGNEWVKHSDGSFTTTDSLLVGPLSIRGADRVFLQVAAFTGTSLDVAYLVHNPVAPPVLETRPESIDLGNSSSAPVAAPANFQVFVPYDSAALGDAVENDVGLNTVFTAKREDTGQDGDDSTTGFVLGTVSTPIVSGFAGMVTIIATISSSEETMTDDGAGNLSGSAGTGTVVYATGVSTVTFSSPPDNLTDILVTYTHDI